MIVFYHTSHWPCGGPGRILPTTEAEEFARWVKDDGDFTYAEWSLLQCCYPCGCRSQFKDLTRRLRYDAQEEWVAEKLANRWVPDSIKDFIELGLSKSPALEFIDPLSAFACKHTHHQPILGRRDVALCLDCDRPFNKESGSYVSLGNYAT